jgi:transglutaminase-like putative cysteine protease
MSLLRRKSRNAGPRIPLGRNWSEGRWLLFAISFAAVAVSMGSVAWASGQTIFVGIMLVAAALGHLLSASQVRPKFRLSYIRYPIALVIIFTMRADLLGVLGGGALLPLSRVLVVIQAMASFNLRSMRTLYDTLLVGTLAVLIASEGALSVAFLIFPLVFGVVAMLFLVTAHLFGETQRSRWVRSPGPLSVAAASAALVVLTFAAGLSVFLLMPQPYRLVNAYPLPSRVDLTSGRPLGSIDPDGGDAAPWSQFLPTRDAGGASGSGTGDPTGDNSLLGTDADLALSPEALGYAVLGYQGEPAPDIVMYVRSPMASYWRGQVLDVYDGLGWKDSGDTVRLVTDKSGNLRFADTPPWFGRVRNYVQSFYLQVPQPDTVFTGYSPGLIVVPDPASEGEPMDIALENLNRLQSSESYRIVSPIPSPASELLNIDVVDTDRDADLRLPPSVTARTRALAFGIVEGASSDFEKAARLEAFLLENYSYDLRIPPFSRSGDVVDRFLFENQAGFCAQFATGMAVMARTVGLPARVAIGYMPGKYNSLTGVHEVRVQDAHAWVEVKFEQYGWVPFDPTPRADSPFATDIGYAGATAGLQQMLRAQFGDIVQTSGSAITTGVTSLFQGPGLITILVVMGGATLAIVIRFRRWRWRRIRRTRGYTRLVGGGREHVVSVYRRALRTLEGKGYPPRKAHQAPGDYLAHLEAADLYVPVPFRDLSHRAAAALYDPRPQESLIAAAVGALIKPLRKLPRLDRGAGASS